MSFLAGLPSSKAGMLHPKRNMARAAPRGKARRSRWSPKLSQRRVMKASKAARASTLFN
ncbi:hypothetical protein QO002_001540 [Pararhizobium capsulatum DSM 1112]|uniref:Uncharacterized protein n=1 Tax=Pararhizobium capsulatum DSM 1112 TaxID=1121113 RepID=A0ABU0BRA3_9HYPH|nr:hypothetical protein [Pararhizobium capsulatum DSM 1112]